MMYADCCINVHDDGEVSRPRCDPILKEREGPTKDRNASWRRFCKVEIGKVMKQIMGKVEAKGLDRKAWDSFASVLW